MRPAIDDIPGYRRRFIVTPAPDCVRAELEDDIHRMGVAVHHDGVIATRIEPIMHRAPWTTCPGAIAKLEETFTGIALDAFVSRGEKKFNCTHLHDLALLAASHAHDDAPLVYDALISDPMDGESRAELRRNGQTVLSWTLRNFQITEPAMLAGFRLDKLGSWIETLNETDAEAARILRWASFVSHGRIIPLDQQSTATEIPPNCYTFQPEMAKYAIRVGKILDFSNGSAQLIEAPIALG